MGVYKLCTSNTIVRRGDVQGHAHSDTVPALLVTFAH